MHTKWLIYTFPLRTLSITYTVDISFHLTDNVRFNRKVVSNSKPLHSRLEGDWLLPSEIKTLSFIEFSFRFSLD